MNKETIKQLRTCAWYVLGAFVTYFGVQILCMVIDKH